MEPKYADGQPVKIGDEFQMLKFVGWERKKFTVGAILDGRIVYMTSNIGAGDVHPEECIKFDQKMHDHIRNMLDAHVLSAYDVKEEVLSMIGGDAE